MGNNTIIGIETTFGALRQIKVGGSIYNSSDKDRFIKFKGEIEPISHWQYYGQYNENLIHLFQQNEEIPIKIGEWEFCPIVKDVHYWQRTTESNNHHNITLNGRDGNGRIFEKTLVIRGEELLPGIVYAMVLLSYVNDVALGLEYWEALSGRCPWNQLTYGEHLDKVVSLNRLCKTILEEHPYMELFLQNGMRNVVEQLKESILQLEILK